MASRQGGTLSGFTPLSTPNAPTGLSVAVGIGSAEGSFSAPSDTGDAAVTSFIVTAIDESTDQSIGETGGASPISFALSSGTFKFRAQAVNGFGPGRLTEFEEGVVVPYSGAALYAWGRNSEGQLGVGGTANRSSPTQVGATINWAQVSAGEAESSHTAAIRFDGTLWTWGSGADGKLGHDNVSNSLTPLQVGALTHWAQVSAGYNHTAAVTTNGELYTWGDNSPQGALGDNTVINKSSPVQIGTLTNWAQVSAGASFCSAVKTDGTLWSWGQNSEGRLGDNTTISRSSPVQIGALTTWAQVSAGLAHGVAITTDNKLYTWGEGANGRLGHNNVLDKDQPDQVGALTNWAQASAGLTHTNAVKTDGTLWGWGANTIGAIGDNTSITRSSPVQVGLDTNWAQAAGGKDFSAAIKTDGTLWTWGQDADGKLGSNDDIRRSSPVQIGASTDWFSVTAGNDHTLAIEGVV